MKRRLYIPIDCGGASCASKPGTFCKYLGAVKFGSTPVCMLFSQTSDGTNHLKTLDDIDGWVQRHPDCLKYERLETPEEAIIALVDFEAGVSQEFADDMLEVAQKADGEDIAQKGLIAYCAVRVAKTLSELSTAIRKIGDRQ